MPIHTNVSTVSTGNPREPSADTGALREGPFGLSAGWWPVAFSAEVRQSVRRARLGVRDIALYRDQAGSVRTVADRCPHRWLPLSMGRLTSAGLQCAYHGWTFDGATGRCSLIPGVRPDEKLPARIRVPAYPVMEEGGFVFVWSGFGPPDSLASALPAAGVPAGPAQVRTVRGVAEVRAPHSLVAEALLVNPGKALGLGRLLGCGDETLGPEVAVNASGVVVRRRRLTWNLPRLATFDPVSRRTTDARVAVVPTTGTTIAAADTRGGPAAVRILVGLTPTAGHRTTVRWLVEAQGTSALHARMRLWASMAGRSAIQVVRALETTADAAEAVSDPAVDRVREFRTGAVETEAQ
ncbi:Rieske 2Fe-2S domain-containing protein [Nocardia sp. R6R-6]|uniref:Rieske 2Fe-2S domain-containing protein n=1 Tax=Nocardia sp. R6R-6 TaxID=3459303 RepID=UPI00403DB2D1